MLRLTLTGPNGQSVPAQVKDTGSQTFQVEFSPRVAGEHRIAVAYRKVAIAGSPFSCKVYDVKAIKVKNVTEGIVAKPVTFLGKHKFGRQFITSFKHYSFFVTIDENLMFYYFLKKTNEM